MAIKLKINKEKNLKKNRKTFYRSVGFIEAT